MDHNGVYYWVNNVCSKHFLNTGLHKRPSGFKVAITDFHINFHVSMTIALLFLLLTMLSTMFLPSLVKVLTKYLCVINNHY